MQIEQIRARRSKWRMHGAIYIRRPDVRAIVRAHGRWATAWSCLEDEVLPELEDARYYGTTSIRTVPYAPSGSAELAVAVADALHASNAVLLARHGLVAVAETPGAALAVAESVEHQCSVGWLVRYAQPTRSMDLSRIGET